jgi:RNA polymerase sigma-70 factor (ECF subfamily)
MEFGDTHTAYHADPTVSKATSRISDFLADPENVSALVYTLCLYIKKANLATGDSVREEALEVLSEIAIEALKNADRYDTSRQIRPWLLGIATNIIKRRKVAQAKHMSRENPIRALYPSAAHLSDDELFDRVAELCTIDTENDLIVHEQVTALLSLVSSDDRNIIHLAILHGLSGDSLAKNLGIKHGAARVRLHRALGRLRDALEQQSNNEQEGESYG